MGDRLSHWSAATAHCTAISPLTDDDLVAFIKRASEHLAPGGHICIKDNVSKHGFYLDKDDNSVCRWGLSIASLLLVCFAAFAHSRSTPAQVREILKRTGLTVVKEQIQRGFPPELFPVYMWAIARQ